MVHYSDVNTDTWTWYITAHITAGRLGCGVILVSCFFFFSVVPTPLLPIFVSFFVHIGPTPPPPPARALGAWRCLAADYFRRCCVRLMSPPASYHAVVHSVYAFRHHILLLLRCYSTKYLLTSWFQRQTTFVTSKLLCTLVLRGGKPIWACLFLRQCEIKLKTGCVCLFFCLFLRRTFSFWGFFRQLWPCLTDERKKLKLKWTVLTFRTQSWRATMPFVVSNPLKLWREKHCVLLFFHTF